MDKHLDRVLLSWKQKQLKKLVRGGEREKAWVWFFSRRRPVAEVIGFRHLWEKVQAIIYDDFANTAVLKRFEALGSQFDSLGATMAAIILAGVAASLYNIWLCATVPLAQFHPLFRQSNVTIILGWQLLETIVFITLYRFVKANRIHIRTTLLVIVRYAMCHKKCNVELDDICRINVKKKKTFRRQPVKPMSKSQKHDI